MEGSRPASKVFKLEKGDQPSAQGRSSWRSLSRQREGMLKGKKKRRVRSPRETRLIRRSPVRRGLQSQHVEIGKPRVNSASKRSKRKQGATRLRSCVLRRSRRIIAPKQAKWIKRHCSSGKWRKKADRRRKRPPSMSGRSPGFCNRVCDAAKRRAPFKRRPARLEENRRPTEAHLASTGGGKGRASRDPKSSGVENGRAERND